MRLISFFIPFLFLVVSLPATGLSKDLKVGVVNLNKIFEQYDKRKELEEDFRNIKSKAEDTLKSKQEEAVSLRDEIQLLEVGSPARKKKEEDMEKLLLYLQVEDEMARKNLAKSEKDFYEELFQDINVVVADVGKKEAFDLILKKEDVDPKSADLLELRLKIGIGTVLYFSNALDITDKVVESLNRKYKRG
ncbi:MAG TPA: OmpH family outer membrane protein [Candidatus Hypogeohydataceae bacterium YC41]